MKDILDVLSGFRGRGVVFSLDGSGRNIKVKGNVQDLSASDRKLLKERKDDIVLLLRQAHQISVNIEPLPNSEHYALSSSQRRLWLLSQFEEAAAVYHIPLSFVLEGEVDEQLFSRAFNGLIARHESLRTIFTEDNEGEPRQVILEAAHSGFALSCMDLRRSSNAEREVQELMTRYNAETFDLGTGPLIRAVLVRMEEKKWILHCVLHHIIGDGWSVHILVQELLRLYDAYSKGEETPLVPLRIQYKDYAVWQQEQLSSERSSKDKTYWLQHFEGELPILELPVDRARPKVKTYNGALVERQLSSVLASALAALSQQQGGTLFMGLLASVNALLYRYSGQQDIIVGTPIAGREHTELEGLIGLFLNTLALRTRVDPGVSFYELLEQVKEVTLGAFAHQAYPFEELVESLGLRRDRSRNPLFDVAIVLQNAGLHTAEQQETGGIKASVHKGADVRVSRFDLTFAFVESAAGLQLSIEYNSDIYNKATVERMAAHLEQLMGAALAQPEASITNLDYLSEEEKHQLLVQFNHTAAEYPKDKMIVQLLEEQAARTPGAEAVLYEDKTLTYRELNEQANQLAYYLRNKYGCGSEDLVGVRLERSERMIIALLGVLKSGAAYVPIDPGYPQERIDYIISHSNCRLVIDEGLLGDFLQSAEEYPRENSSFPGLSPSHLAYVIYTSGSTGTPKGVQVEHRNLVHSTIPRLFTYSGLSSFLLLSSISFDSSVAGIFGTLAAGGRLCIASRIDVDNVIALSDYIVRARITHLLTIPSYYKLLLAELVQEDNSLKQVIVAGEACPAQLVEQHLAARTMKDCELFNEYGPTEATVWSTVYRYSREEGFIDTIGKPIPDTKVYILGGNDELLPVGVVGQICISGGGVARGYLDNPGLTAEKFSTNPFRPGERMYRTGDLGRWLPDGNIEFLGRKDNQVKIRGYRIELEEIENALQSLEGIRAAVVVARSTAEGEKDLVAYLISSQTIVVQDLRSSLGRTLPAYMIPTWFVQMDDLPLTPNGKVDCKRLPEPGELALASTIEYILPRNPAEEKLASIWQEILGKDRVGVKDNFFDLGGHSLKASRLANRIHREFKVKVELKDIFNHMTLEEQAELLIQSRKSSFTSIVPVTGQVDYPVSSPQRRLWILSQFEEGNIAYNMPGAYLFEGELDQDAFSWSLHALAERHENLRTVFRQNSEGRLRQVIRPVGNTGFELLLHDLRNERKRKQKVKELVQQESVRPFHLVDGPLLRASLYRIEENQWVFSYVLHHIIGDGWSMQILMKELLLLYNARVQGAEYPLKPLRIQYKDYATWQQDQLSGASLHHHKAYWLKQFEGGLPLLELSADRPRPPVKSYRGAVISRRFAPELNNAFKALAKQQDATLYMGLLAAVNVLLYRYTGQEDIIIGSPIAGRQHADLEDQIGFYVNMLALRTRLRGSDSFEKLLLGVKKETLEAYQYQAYPFDELVEEVHLSGDTSRHPLFDVVVVLQNTEIHSELGATELKGVKLRPYDEPKRVVSLFDLRFDFREMDGQLFLALEYNSDIYNRDRMERMADNFHQLLHSILEQPAQSIAELDYISGPERSLLSLAGAPASYPANTTLIDLFEKQVERTPHHTAISFKDETLSYTELNERANRVAHFLLSETGLKKGEGAGILLSRRPECIIAILGILKAGGVYIPMEPDTPEDRLRFMINDTGMRVAISEKAFIELLNRLQWSCPRLDAYLCVDSRDVYAEKEREENTMMSRELWDHVGEKAADQITGGGWSSSFTGEALPAEEMEEYAMNAYYKLSGLLHSGMRVLEIGCSSGLTLFKIAPLVELYYGTDMSPVILENTRQMVERTGLANVKLKCLVAHEISSLEEKGFDLIIINSVIQHFHGHNYLRKVIADGVGLLNDRGMIFVGDVMDMELKNQLVQDLEEFKAQNKGRGHTTKTDFSADLFVAKGFFEDLVIDQPGITGVNIAGKIRTIENELTLYRYDAILQVNKSKAEDPSRKKNKYQYSCTMLDVQPSHNPQLPILCSDLAYIIYTSGTTGRPKGSLIEHRNVVRLFMTDSPLFDFNRQDVWTLFHSISFDFSVWEMYGALLFGGKLVIVPSSTAKDPALFRQLLLRHRVTVLNQTPSAFYNLIREEMENEALGLTIRYVIFGGEALSPGKLAGWRKRYPKTELINMYGITETTVHVTYKRLSDEDIAANSSNIGKPIPTLSCYVLDQNQQQLPIGVWGELYVGGEGVCRGYLNRGELTAQRFLSSPFRTGERLYRTGDKARLMENGELEYGGRIDEQVKIRGYRIELGEIRHMLEQHSDIESAVVTARASRDGEQELVAYLVSSITLGSADLSAYLSRSLPSFMLPAHYVQLSGLPLTANGKINHKALPDPEGLNMDSGVDYVAPRNEIEQKLVAIWQEVLRHERISVKDNFFDLGGHSLKATRLTNHIYKSFGTKMELKNIFLYPILEDQARVISRAAAASFDAIPMTAPQASYPLSSSQRRVWVLCQFEDANMAYNMPGVNVFEGSLDHKVLEAAFVSLIERHESLRTVFRQNDQGEIRQFIQPAEASGFTLSYLDFRSREDREEEVKHRIRKDHTRAFDLSTGPLLRVSLYQVEDSKWVFSYVIHHIISDGWSMNILVRELLQFYAAHAKGEDNPLAPLRIQYKDYAVWQQQQLSGENLKAHKDYWLKQFEGELPMLELSIDKPRPAVKTYNGSSMHLHLSAELTRGLKALSQQNGGTLFIGIIAVINGLLYRYTGQQDIIIGSPIAGRPHADLEGQIGFYINTLALRSRFSVHDNFGQLLDHVKQVTLDAYQHQDYPFDELVDNLDLHRDTTRSALFDVMVVLQNNESDGGEALQDIGSLYVSSYGSTEISISKFDLIFDFIEVGDELHLTLIYNTDIYSHNRVEQLGRHLEQLLSAIIHEPRKPLQQLEYLTGAETHQLLQEFNNTSVDYPHDKTIAGLFAEQAEKTPERIALVFEGTEISYRELHEQSNQLAHYLKENHNIQPDDMVGIMLDRSDKIIIAILGVLKSGAAYVPIDADYPGVRKEFIVKDTGIKALITQSDYIFDISYFDGGVFAMDLQLDTLETSTQMPELSITSTSLAYVMYTSGSTGQPKGVLIEHRGVVRLVKSANYINLTGDEVIVSTGAVSFDATSFEFWAMLLNGGQLVMSRKEVLLDNSLLLQEVRNRKANILWSTTAWLNQLIDENIEIFQGIRTVLSGGEKISRPRIQKLRSLYPQMQFVHCYGPTENTGFSLACDIEEVEQIIPIGKPISNSTAFILDAQHQPVPVGVAGDICVGGDGLARGYLNNPELTAHKFITVDLPLIGETRIYKTGDLGRWREDGLIEFLGRRDAQVKIRGFRIELGEIENALQSHPGIDSAVVMATGSADEKELAAYVVGSGELNAADMAAYLAGMLPSYMVPAHFVQLDELPLNSNGKVDRRKLPDAAGVGILSGVEYMAPRNEREEKLVEIWKEILGKKRISVKDNFFDLGGHSLKITRLASQIHKQFDVRIELKELFEATVLEDQAKLVAQSARTSFVTIEPVQQQEDYALSSSQRRLWVLSQFEQANMAYNMPGVYVFEGSFDQEAFGAAFASLIERHESLRTTFRETHHGEVRQFIQPAGTSGFVLNCIDLRKEEGREMVVKNLVQKEHARAFDLSSGPLLRASLYQMENDRWVFSYVMHHIISDGWSMGILVKELLQFYNAHVKGEAASLPPLRIQYKDYAAWQQQQLSEENLKAHKDYWLQQFKGELAVLKLPLDKPRPALKTYNGAVIDRTIDPELSRELQVLARRQDATLFMGLLAAVNILLYRYTGQEDIIIGSPIAGREHSDLEDQIGFYVNTLVIRSRFNGEDSCEQLLSNIKELTLKAYEHQLYPFDELVNELGLARDMSRNALFDVMVVLQNAVDQQKMSRHSLEGITVSGHSGSGNTISKFDLLFNFSETGSGIELHTQYNTDLFHRSTIERMVTHLEQLLWAVVKAPSAPVSRLDYLEQAEKSQLLAGFNNTKADYPEAQTIVELFAAQAEKTPERIALVFEETEISYRELHERSNQLAHYLKENHNIQPDDMVGIMLDRSDKIIIAILGVLKSGAAYVPIDADYPGVRKEFIMRDTGIKALITQTQFRFDIGYFSGGVFAMDLQLDTLETSTQMPRISITPTSLAYVMYTSGSTGQPKGVMVEHRGVVRLVKCANFVNLRGDEVLLSTGAVSFDATTFEFWAMLLNGGTLVMSRKEVLLDSSLLAREIKNRQVDMMWFTAGWLHQLVDGNIEMFEGLKTILAGGDKLSALHIKKLKHRYPQMQIVNGYGPTENTTFSLSHNIEEVEEIIPIGKPISNSTAFILDAQHQPVPVGVVGEICVGGDGLARGYLNNPELTAEKFITVGLPLIGETRIYKTGDLGRWREDGLIEFIGRRDAQVKIRGFRIELGEIENALQSHPGIDSAVVMARGSADEKELAAYVVGTGELNAADMAAYLAGMLPSYMVPAHFVQLDELPLNSHGKVDRRKLPDAAGVGILSGVEYMAPRNEREEKLVEIWQEILGKKRIGVKDNFFDLGGHSLKITRLASQIHKQFDVRIELKELFEATVLEDQAKLVAQSARTSFVTIEPVQQQEDYVLSSSQRRLWVLSQFEEANMAYNIPGACVFGGDLDQEAFGAAFASLIERHESLRTTFRENHHGEVRQFIQPAGTSGFVLNCIDLRKEEGREMVVKDLVQKDFIKTFDLSAGPLLRASLYRVEDDRWVFSYVMHHIISDGWSMGILVKELLQFYNAHVKGEAASLPPLRIQYKDYTAWQQQQLSEENLKAHKDYWLQQFEGELPVLELPADKPRPALKTYNGRSIHLALSAELSRQFKTSSQQQGGTLFMGLLAVVNALLYRYTGQQDIIIGSPIAGREHSDLQDQIGFYINTLALRSRFSGSDSFTQLLGHVKQVTLDAYEHQVYPFDDLVDNLDLRRDMSRSLLFDVLLVLQNNDSDGGDALQSLSDLRVNSYTDSELQVSKFDLEFSFTEAGEQLHVFLGYNSDIYSQRSMEQLLRHLERLVSAVVHEPQKPIEQLDYLGEEEKQQLLQFNGPHVDYPQNKTIVHLFEEQVKRTPRHIALQVGDRTLTYKELNRRVNRLASFLKKSIAISPGDFVGIRLERTEWMVIATLAVLKTGAAYVPIDTGYPQDRVEYMTADSKCRIVVDEPLLDRFRLEQDLYTGRNLRLNIDPENLAYIIYTSGSTGRPKGVMVRHRNLSHFFANVFERYTGKTPMVMPFIASHAFDISVFDMFAPLLCGGTSLMVEKEDMQDMNRFAELLSRATFIDTVPGVYHLLANHILENKLEASFRRVEKIFIGGDAIADSLLQRLSKAFSAAWIVVAYGPTEGTIFCTDLAYAPGTLPADAKGSVIGRPMANTSLYILDTRQRPVPAEVKGEICIAGHGLTKGYLNRPELTAEKYINVHLFDGTETPVYRTGDLGRWLPDGTIEFMGRIDHQVKIRGFRIETGEIESVLQAHDAIDSAIVLVRSGAAGEKELVAYTVAKRKVAAADLKSWLSESLPYYMVPAYFVELDKMPLSSNGKIDRSKLPDPGSLGVGAAVEYVAPRNEVEEKLVEIWQEILGKERIGVKDNFFELGGHSLRMTRLASQVYKKFNVKMEWKTLFGAAVLEDLAGLIARSARTSFATIEPVEQQQGYILSSSQRRLWVLSQFEEANAAYNMPGVYVFEGVLDYKALEASFTSLIKRHESLRTTFSDNDGGEARQFIQPAGASGFVLNYIDLRNEEGCEMEVKSLVQEEHAQPFDLTAGPLLRASLYQMKDDRWVFSYVMHHIISDGWSMNILIRELLQFYNAEVKGEAAPLAPLRIQYKDYAAWQQQQLSGENLKAHKDYWQKQFEGELPILELPADNPRPVVKTYNGRNIHLALSAELSQGLKALSRQQGGTLFMGILAAVNALLYRYTGQQDIIIGSPIAGRQHADLDDQIGFYVNTLALRSRFSGGQNFRQLLDHVKQVTLDAYEHQVYPFDELVGSLNLQRDMSRSPLFDVMVGLQNQQAEGDALGLGNLQVSDFGMTRRDVSKFDLIFNFSETGTGLQVALEYNTDIYKQERIERLARHLEQLLSAIVREPQKPIRQLDYLEEGEKKKLAIAFNDTRVDYPQDKTIVRLFEEQAEQTPGRIALVFEETTLTYKELNEQSNRLAYFLRSRYELREDEIVGLHLERSHRFIVAVLGILKAGAAYLPLDAGFPQERITALMQDSGSKVLLDEQLMQEFLAEANDHGSSNPSSSLLPSSLAYVMYTSGSTGKPKGVMVEHRGVVRTVKSPGYIDLTGEEVLLSTGALSFDAITFEFWSMLLNGGTLVMSRREALLDSSLLAQEIRSRNVDMMFFTTGWLNQLVDENIELFGGLKTLVTGGDKISPPHIKKLRERYPQMQIVNGYGPTENTTFSLTHSVDIVQDNIPVGKPLSNSTAYILDEQQQLVPVGVVGEICVGGDGLARGYLNNPELTAEKFVTVDLPFVGKTRLYKSGDLGRWMEDGNIEFIGRRDAQVKIRGFRIEPGEIESALLGYDKIVSAVVTARANASGEKELVAYITGNEELDVVAIRAYLGSILPAYMIPVHFVQLDEFPLTSSGKVDRKRLPEPQGAGQPTTEYIAPRNEIEEKLVVMWQEVLGRERIGVKDNFFELGGHSLKVTRLASRIRKEFEVTLSMSMLFSNPTIEAVAAEIESTYLVNEELTEIEEENSERFTF